MNYLNGKLIRDKYIDIIDKKDLTFCENDDTLKFLYLYNKINEELGELKDTVFNDVYEFADVIEALYAMAKFQGISIEDINLAREKKNLDKGSFNSFLILKNV